MTTKELIQILEKRIADKSTGKECSGKELGIIIQDITEREIKEGGPYTAIPGDPGGIDLGLNKLIAEFLILYEIELPNVNAFLLENNVELFKLDSEANIKDLDLEEEDVRKSIWEAANSRFKGLPPFFQERANFVIERTLKGNPDKQMSLMALHVKRALGDKCKDIPISLIGELGLANIFFWAAFIIYDDFWDKDEAADPQLLPVANLFARHYTNYFSSLLPETRFREFFHNTMDELDSANEWETTFCRLNIINNKLIYPTRVPDYEDYAIKYYPAAGHIMGPVALLLKAGYEVNSTETASFIEYCKHYLIAMQLNDDAHDWKEDINRGHISTMVGALLIAWQKDYPNKRDINLVEDMPALEQLYWYKTLVPICESILKHTALAREALNRVHFHGNTNFLQGLIVRNENLARQAISEQEQSLGFIDSFQ
jgi:hypothetical protein